MFHHLKELPFHAASLLEAKHNGEYEVNEKHSEDETSAIHTEAARAES